MWQGKAAVYGEDALKLVRLNGIGAIGVRYHKLFDLTIGKKK